MTACTASVIYLVSLNDPQLCLCSLWLRVPLPCSLTASLHQKKAPFRAARELPPPALWPMLGSLFCVGRVLCGSSNSTDSGNQLVSLSLGITQPQQEKWFGLLPGLPGVQMGSLEAFPIQHLLEETHSLSPALCPPIQLGLHRGVVPEDCLSWPGPVWFMVLA